MCRAPCPDIAEYTLTRCYGYNSANAVPGNRQLAELTFEPKKERCDITHATRRLIDKCLYLEWLNETKDRRKEEPSTR